MVGLWLGLAALSLAACSRSDPAPRVDVELTLAAYSAPREVFEREIIPAFVARYRAETGKTVRVEASYLASGAQARAVLGGFEADVVALALAPDLDGLTEAGLVTGKWKEAAAPFATSVVALAVRPGNPKNIHSFADIARPGIEVLMPNPKTSGGAMWNATALHGAALRGHAGVAAGDAAEAERFLAAVLRNVSMLDKAARESMITFEKGVGDVAVTYETEIVAGQLAGRRYDAVVPDSTLLIETCAAVVDGYARKHGTLETAEAFVSFLRTPDAQRAFVRHGFRSVDPGVAAESAALRPQPADLFTIHDLGGWPTVTRELFGKKGLFARTWEAASGAP